MAHVSLNCPQLLELDFQSCHKLSDNAIRQAATACPLLAKLDMSSCSCVTDETLRDIASSCPSLSVLDASNCPNISFEVCLTLGFVYHLSLTNSAYNLKKGQAQCRRLPHEWDLGKG
jgi:hypothetical protein